MIGTYVEQLEKIAKRLRAPLITGKTPHNERDVLFDDFRTGRINLLVVSKVANFSIDLPDANIAIQISGTFGSRQGRLSASAGSCVQRRKRRAFTPSLPRTPRSKTSR